MSRFLNPKYAALEAYVPGEQPQDRKYVKLNTNESPFPPAPGVLAVANEAQARDLRLYPDPQIACLRTALAKLHGVKMENVFVANGSDDILNFAFMVFGADGCAYPDISYGFYSVFAQRNGVRSTVVPLREDFSLAPKDYFGIGKTVVFANPNAPTGLAISPEDIDEICRTNPGHVVLVDEAYVDFGAQSCMPLVERYENLLVVRTFSKSRQMAGARLGYAVAQKAIIDDLELLRNSTNPYNINRLSMFMGTASVEDDPYFRACCDKIVQNRAYCAGKLQEIGFVMTNSKANFLFARHPRVPGGEMYRRLRERGVLVRHFSADRLQDYNRITVGSREEIDLLVAAAREIVREAEG